MGFSLQGTTPQLYSLSTAEVPHQRPGIQISNHDRTVDNVLPVSGFIQAQRSTVLGGFLLRSLPVLARFRVSMQSQAPWAEGFSTPQDPSGVGGLGPHAPQDKPPPYEDQVVAR
jgi:hypothetical protein